MPTGIFLPLEVDFDEDSDVAKLARYTKPGEARALRDLLVAMWRYCKRRMSDGHVPAEIIGLLVYPDTPRVGKRDADRLVECGLAERTDDGYFLPGYLKHNKSRAQIESDSAKLAETGSEAGSFGNHVRWHVQRGKSVPGCTHCRVASPSGADRVNPTESDRGESHRDRGTDRDRDVDQVRGDRPVTLGAADDTQPPECSKHPDGNATDENCHGCRRVREWHEGLAARVAAEYAQRRAGCERCGGTGWIETADGAPAAKCDHRPLLHSVD